MFYSAQDSPESDADRERDKKERENEKERSRQRSESKHKSPPKKRPNKDSVSLFYLTKFSILMVATFLNYTWFMEFRLFPFHNHSLL